MKNLILLCLFIFGVGHINAQITIEKSDITVDVESTIVYSILEDSVILPTEGANQVWDYSFLQAVKLDTVDIRTNNDMTIPSADFITSRQTIQGAGNVSTLFDRTDFYVLNDTAYGNVGVKFDPVAIPIGALTGSPTDSLNFLENYGTYPNDPGYKTWFPMNFEDNSRISNYVVDNEILLTVAAFGLNQVPTLNRVYGNSTHEVVGWGSLSLPNSAEQDTVSLEVLLTKQTTVEQDSFFLAGQPMPLALLIAFGVIQGQTDTTITYNFYTKGGAPDAVLSICDCDSDWMLYDLTDLSPPVQEGITIERSDISVDLESDIVYEVVEEGVPLPSEGANQIWDYSSLEIEFQTTAEVFANNDSIFPDADFYTFRQTIQGTGNVAALFDRTDYHVLNDIEYGRIGVKYDPLSLSIGALTGAPTDSINFLENYGTYPNDPGYIAWFPMNYGNDSRSSNYIVENNLLLTVAAFGLDRVPTLNRVYGNSTHEVVGSGSLSIQNPADQKVVSMDVLLVKTTTIQQDSFFLAGQPMPLALLIAFGVAQGQTDTITSYNFFAKGGFPDAVLTIDQLDENTGGAHILADISITDLDGITIERPDIAVDLETAIVYGILEDSLSFPAEGANQVWDYSSLELIDMDTVEVRANDDPVITDADFYAFRYAEQGAGNVSTIFGRSDYYVLNDTAYGNIGVKFDPVAIPIGALTGAPTDSLNFLENYGTYPNDPGYKTWFPMNYTDDPRSSNYVVDNQILLTVAGFGLNQVPTLNRVYGSSTHEVVGWGTLALPDIEKQNTEPVNVLLTKETTIEQDSFFLAGQPMPLALLIAFGVTQGQTDTTTNYYFYAKGGSPDAVLSICDCNSNWVLYDVLDITSSVDEESELIPFNYYPNPVSDKLNIQFEKLTNEPWIFSIYSTIGQKIYQHTITQPIGPVTESIRFNQHFQSGHYFYVLRNGGQRVMSSGGIHME